MKDQFSNCGTIREIKEDTYFTDVVALGQLMDASPIGASVFALNVSGLRLTFGAFFVYAGFNPYVVIMASLESKELNGQRPVLDGRYVF